MAKAAHIVFERVVDGFGREPFFKMLRNNLNRTFSVHNKASA